MYALLAIAVASNLSGLLDAIGAPNRQNFDAVQYESRFAALRAYLPANTVAGYLSDADPNLTSTLAEYTLAQYALTPVVVANNPDQSVVIANVHTPQPAEFYQAHKLELVRDYGNGVLLLRKASR